MEPVVSVSLELRPVLNICNVRVTLGKDLPENTTADVDADATSFTICVKQNSADVLSTKLVLPVGYRFRHDTRSNIRKRFEQLDADDVSSRRIVLTFSVQVEGQFNTSHSPIANPCEPYNDCLYMFRCRNCESDVLAKETSFRRVLPLPSADWKEMAAEWFCHRHKGDGDVSSNMNPKADELFTSVLCFNVHKSVLANVAVNSVGEIQCENCHEVLSKIIDSKSTTVEMLRTRIDAWELNGSSRLLLRRDATSVLNCLIKQQLSLSVSCRLILETDDSTLLVWVMETGLQHFKEVNIQRESHPICFKTVTKTLYRVAEPQSAVVRSWQEDPLVIVQPVDKALFEEAIAALDASHSGDTLDGFMVGFIPEWSS